MAWQDSKIEDLEWLCMARYKVIDINPRFIAIDLQRPLVPGTFEHVLDCLIDHELSSEAGNSTDSALPLPSRCSAIWPNKRLNRFTLRGRKKVDTRWKLHCVMHNLEKRAHHGFGQ